MAAGRKHANQELTMKTRLSTVSTLLLGAAIIGWVAPAAIADNTPPTVLAGIIRDLGSPEFAVREKAQAQLANIPANEENALRAAAQESTDAEVRGRLHVR